MSDETTRPADPDGAATPNRDRRGEPPIIEGERADAAMNGEAPGARGGAGAREASPAGTSRPFLSAAIGALVGAAVAAGGFWLTIPRFPGEPELGARLARLEKSAPETSEPLAALDKRVGALEAASTMAKAYGERIAALESAALSAKAAADANGAWLADAQAARADAAKALALATAAAQSAREAPASESGAAASAASALEGRVGKLEAALAALNRPAVDLGPVQLRIDKLESALAAPKSDTRAPAVSVAQSRDWAALAVAGQALSDRLRVGAPFVPEQAALERLGADPARLAALKPFAEEGAPSAHALAVEFAKVAPAVQAAGTVRPGGAMDRLFAEMSRVVKVTPVGEVAGDDPAALVSQIGAALDRGQLRPAVAAWERLSEPARQASHEWAGAAKARLAADEAAQGVVEAAIAGLAAANN